MKNNDKGKQMGYLNMAKPQRSFKTIKANREYYEDELKVVYDHIKTVWADNNEEMYDWIMNFNACAITNSEKRYIHVMMKEQGEVQYLTSSTRF
jgi:hypothetical protein